MHGQRIAEIGSEASRQIIASERDSALGEALPDSGWARTTTSSMVFSDFYPPTIHRQKRCGKEPELSAIAAIAELNALRGQETVERVCISTP